MTYGWRKVFLGQREKIELGREKMWARIHLTPVLQAEEDRDQVRRYYADLKREKELLGSQSGAYNSDRYVFSGISFAFVQGLGRGRGEHVGSGGIERENQEIDITAERSGTQKADLKRRRLENQDQDRRKDFSKFEPRGPP